MYRTLVILAAALVLTACGSGKDNKIRDDDRPVVSVVKAEAAAGPSMLRASGLVAYQREPALSFKLGGVIDRIAVDEGDFVRTGQRLAWLRPTEVAAGAKEASAALEVAQRNLERTKTLFDKGLVAQARLDDAQLAVERARAGSDAAGFNRDTAVILAPADGVILRRLAEPAQVTAAGAPILTLGEVQSGLIVKAAFPSSAAARIKAGAPATITVTDTAGAAFNGRVTRIAGKGDGSTGAFDVEIQIASPKGLRSGMVAEAVIDVGSDAKAKSGTAAVASAVRIPAMALLDARADQGSVYVVDPQGVARRRIVQTAGLQGETVTVIAGLAPGETIVATGAAYVRDGAAVAIAR